MATWSLASLNPFVLGGNHARNTMVIANFWHYDRSDGRTLRCIPDFKFGKAVKRNTGTAQMIGAVSTSTLPRPCRALDSPSKVNAIDLHPQPKCLLRRHLHASSDLLAFCRQRQLSWCDLSHRRRRRIGILDIERLLGERNHG